MKRTTIGIAGYMGSGKSSAAAFLASRQAVVINADETAKVIIANNPTVRKRLVDHYGPSISTGTTLRFDVLGNLVFSSLGQLQQYNGIVHPLIIKELGTLLNRVTTGLCVLDAALIPYWNIEYWFDSLIWIEAQKQVRIRRICEKKQLSSLQVQQRMDLQESLVPAPAQDRWHYVVNDGPIEELQRALQNHLGLIE
ncbi:MAG: dephospho-CoA kinase [Chitinivibrionales bacterium]|nr:dephospho-CoA kinase [Chitinivibrionales bacterium]